jgi:hypothetical protein
MTHTLKPNLKFIAIFFAVAFIAMASKQCDLFRTNGDGILSYGSGTLYGPEGSRLFTDEVKK